MTTIAVTGDLVTTTVLALAAGWPSSDAPDPVTHVGRDDIVVVECDPTGGSLAAWLDMPATPSISTVVTALHQATATSDRQRWSVVEHRIRLSPAGPRVLPAPFRAREARSAVSEAGRELLPLLAGVGHTTALLDLGRLDVMSTPPALLQSELTVVVHRQEPASARAAAARLERLAEAIDHLATTTRRAALVVVGDEPFAVEEIVAFAAPDLAHWSLPFDPLAAAVLAGRHGVSARRLARQPLLRAAADVSADLASTIGASAIGPAGPAPTPRPSQRSITSTELDGART